MKYSHIPQYGVNTIAEIFTSAAAALGVSKYENILNIPSYNRICVLLVDGMGLQILRNRIGHISFLRKNLDESSTLLYSTFPSTTATAMTSFGTGVSPGKHGICGYEILDKKRNTVVKQLGDWDKYVDPSIWQPYDSVSKTLFDYGISSFMVGDPKFRNSSLSQAAFGHMQYFGVYGIQDLIDRGLHVLKSTSKNFTYLYWNHLDKMGHRYGTDSFQFTAELESIDSMIKSLVCKIPKDTLFIVTADHGMLDVDISSRIDYSLDRDLVKNVLHTGGEPRVVHLYTEPEFENSVAQIWRDRYGEDAWIETKYSAIDAGWFGDVDSRMADRIGNVVVAAKSKIAFYDMRRSPAKSLNMVGQHGSFSEEEMSIPFLLF